MVNDLEKLLKALKVELSHEVSDPVQKAAVVAQNIQEPEEEEEEIRIFTLQEARGLIPTLRRLLGRMTRARDRLLDLRIEIDQARENARYGGGSPM